MLTSRSSQPFPTNTTRPAFIAVNPQHQGTTTRTLSGVGVRKNFYPDLVSWDTDFCVPPFVPPDYRCGFGVANRPPRHLIARLLTPAIRLFPL